MVTSELPTTNLSPKTGARAVTAFFKSTRRQQHARPQGQQSSASIRKPSTHICKQEEQPILVVLDYKIFFFFGDGSSWASMIHITCPDYLFGILQSKRSPARTGERMGQDAENGELDSENLLVDLGQDTSGSISEEQRQRVHIGNILMVPEEGVFLLADLDRISTELYQSRQNIECRESETGKKRSSPVILTRIPHPRVAMESHGRARKSSQKGTTHT